MKIDRWRWLGIALAGITVSGANLTGSVEAQLTAEQEVRVDPANGLENRFGRVSEIENGEFVVLWTGRAPGGDSAEVLGRRFRADGAPADEPFVVASSTTISIGASDVARTPVGEFVVAWVATELSEYDSRSGVKARRVTAQGDPQGAEIDVAAVESGTVRFFARADAHSDGSFVVVWGERDFPLGTGVAINGRRFAADGEPIGGEFQVKGGASLEGGYGYSERMGAVHLDIEAQGSFVVVWSSCYYCGADEDDDWVIAGRNVSAENIPESQFEISGWFENLGQVAFARSESSDFFAAWRDYDGLNGQRFERSGAAASEEFVVHPEVLFDPELDIAMTPQGEMVAVWVEAGEIRGRRLDGRGTPLGEAFQVNASTTGNQARPQVESDASGFVVSWTRLNPPEPEEEGVYLRRFWVGRIFADGFESGDTSAWREVFP